MPKTPSSAGRKKALPTKKPAARPAPVAPKKSNVARPARTRSEEPAIDDSEDLFADYQGGEVERFLGTVARRHALLIGVNQYDHPRITRLKYAVNDVRQLERVLGAYGYEVQTLEDGQDASRRPTYENVIRELEALGERAEPEDLVLVHFSCHGKLRGDETLLLLADTKWEKDRYAQVLSVEEVKRRMLEGRSRRQVLLLDACQKGDGGREVIDPNDHGRFMRNAYLNAQGLVVLASCSDGQIANEPDSLGHGAFTYYVLEGLRRHAVDPTTQLVTAGKLATYVTARLQERWKSEGVETLQIPEFELREADLAIADRSQLKSPEVLERSVLSRLQGHSLIIRAILPAPDGHRMLTASEDGVVLVWKDGKLESTDAPYTNPTGIKSAALSPDGRVMATVGLDGIARLWRVGTQEVLAEIHSMGAPYLAAAFSPDNRLLALSSEVDVALWSLKHMRLEMVFIGHEAPIHSVAFSQDGKLMASTGHDGRVMIRDAVTKELLHELSFPNEAMGPFSKGVFSPDGRWLAVCGDDPSPMAQLANLPRVVNTQTGATAFKLQGHTKEVTSIAFSPDGRRLLTGSRDGTARLWDAANGTLSRIFDQPPMDISAAAFSADGNSIILGCVNGDVYVMDVQERSPAKSAGQPSKAATRKRK
jgi:WD40 repeat protein